MKKQRQNDNTARSRETLEMPARIKICVFMFCCFNYTCKNII